MRISISRLQMSAYAHGEKEENEELRAGLKPWTR